jgi:glycosyltransferase involved in cell wall biosynthesis
MNLLMVSHYFDSHPGGIEAVAGQMYRRIAGRGVPIRWAAAGVTEVPEAAGSGAALPLRTWNAIEDRVGLPFPVPGLKALRALRRAVRSADVVLLHDCLYLGNLLAYLIARMSRVPVIVVQHSTARWSNPILDALMQLANLVVTRGMLRGADQVVFISNTTRSHFQSIRFRSPPELVFNGVDTGTFSPLRDGGQKPSIREKLGLPRTGPVASFVGRFVDKKGLPILREMARLAPEITWALAGGGPLNPEDWGSANVRVFSGLRGSALADLYRASDVFVLASEREGFPLVIQEAVSCGVPVVCSADVAKADAALDPVVRTVPLDPKDVPGSAAAFLRAVREAVLAQPAPEQRRAWHELACSRYGWSRAVDRYLGIANRLAEERRARAVTLGLDRDRECLGSAALQGAEQQPGKHQ